MHYQLGRYLRFCEVEGQLIFLDIEKDQYFKLNASTERAFRSVLAEEDVAERDLDDLIDIGILTRAPKHNGFNMSPVVQRPSRSLMELPFPRAAPGLRLSLILELAATFMRIRWQLRSHPLMKVLEEAATWRRAEGDTPGHPCVPLDEKHISSAAIEFIRARAYIPIAPSCLLDSLALARFLSRRRLSADIILGVTLHPFAAHCWVQTDELILNETLSDTNAYTPIAVV